MKIRDLTHWEAFFHVAEEKSFSRAAQKMRISAPFLSKKVAALEEELGTRLFQRTTRKIGLTEAGQGFLPHVTSILADLNNLENKLENTENLKGTIRFTCPVGLGHRLLSPLIVEFSKAHPEIKFDIDVSDHVVDIVEEQMDFAIRIQEPQGANFIFKKLAINRHVFCATPRYLRESSKERLSSIRSPKDLHRHRMLMLDSYFDYRFKNTKKSLREFAKRQAIRGVSGMFLTELALNHGGIAIRSLWDIKEHLNSGRLVEVLTHHPLENFGDIYVVIPDRKYISFKVRAFIDFLFEKAKSWDT